MISVCFSWNENGYHARSEGHADYDPGHDPVCAAVSAIMFGLAGSLKTLTQGGDSCLRWSVEQGIIQISFYPSSQDEDTARLLFLSAAVGITQVQMSHPDNVRVEMDNILQMS